MTADERAALVDALVERVARKLSADTCGSEVSWPLYMRRATAAIDLIRAETLEEAAKVADEAWRDTGRASAILAAIRAMKENPDAEA